MGDKARSGAPLHISGTAENDCKEIYLPKEPGGRGERNPVDGDQSYLLPDGRRQSQNYEGEKVKSPSIGGPGENGARSKKRGTSCFGVDKQTITF